MNTKDNKTVTPEEKNLITALFSSAALLGDALFYYGRNTLNITFDGYREAEEKADAANKEWLATFGDLQRAAVGRTSGAFVKEPESPGDQTIQVLTLLRPEVRAAFGDSAIYSIFSDALSRLGRSGTTLEEKIDGLNLVSLSGIWIITKRVFVLGHRDDCFRMVDCILSLAKSEETAPLSLSGASSADIDNVSTFFSAYFEGLENPDSFPVEKKPEIAELESTETISLMQDKVSRNVIRIAKDKEASIINVGPEDHPIAVTANILGRNGEPATVLTRVDYCVMEAVGQIIQENGKNVLITPQQIFRKITFADPSYHASKTSIEEITSSMIKLMDTPASINFSEQIEQHTKLKASNEIGRLKGHLISGIYYEPNAATYKGRTVGHSFLVYDMPMFFYYAHILNHIVTVPGHLLSGDVPRDRTKQKKAQTKSASDNRVSLEEYGLRRYLLEKIEFFKKKKEKTGSNTYSLLFSTIAEEIDWNLMSDKDPSVLSNKKLRTLREQTYEFLQLQAKKRNIRRCDYYAKGRAYYGVIIIL